MEFATQGTLLSYINSKKGIPEIDAQKLFIQIYNVLRHLHIYHFLVHRDLKLENILLDSKGNIKLTDFGLAGTFYCNNLRTFVGTPGYTPPEIIQGGDYDEKCDVWSLGICLYALLTASLPFSLQTNNYKLFVEEVNSFIYPQYFSPMLQDLLRKMFVIKPSNRLNLIQLQNHPWLKGIPQISMNIIPRPIVFYKVNSIEDISKFKRKSFNKPDQNILNQCLNLNLEIDLIIKSLEDGYVNNLTTIYFCYLYPLYEKPEIKINIIPSPKIIKNSKIRNLNDIKTTPPNINNKYSPKSSSLQPTLKKQIQKTVVTPTRKTQKLPLSKFPVKK